jgi:protocatechuate 3,4-dioxygenase beta subunit
MRILRTIALSLAAATAARSDAGVLGRVLDADGRPLVGARVEAFALESPDERGQRLADERPRTALGTVVTSPSGAFELTSAEPVMDVVATASGYAPACARLANGATFTFALRQAATSRGLVVSAGKPVAGALVVWTYDGEEIGQYELARRTGADGAYELPDPSAWANGVVAILKDHAPLTQPQRRLGMGSIPRLELGSGLTVEGRVLDSAGRGVVGAQLRVDGWPFGSSGAGGAFVLRHVPSGWTTLVARSAGAYGSTRPRPGALVVRVVPQPRLDGVVRERQSSRPLAGAAVTLHSTTDGTAFAATTDVAGRFRIEAPEGRYYAGVTRPGYTAITSDTLEEAMVELRGAAADARRDFELAPLRRVRGRVQDEEQRAIEGAFVTLTSKQQPRVYSTHGSSYFGGDSAWTAADGTFDLTFPPQEGSEGEWVAMALKPGLAMGVVDGLKARGQGAPLAITLTRGVELAGRVVDEAGAPIAGAAVLLAESAGFTGSLSRWDARSGEDGWVRSDARGSFAVSVRPGAHELLVRAKGRAPRALHAYEPASGSPLSVVLEPAVEIRGRAVRADGAGVGGVQVYSWRALMGAPVVATTDDSGAFVLAGLAAGLYQVRASVEGRAFGEMLTAEAPATDVRIELKPAGRVEGRVTSSRTRQPVDRFTVTVESAQRGGVDGDIRGSEFPTGAAGEEPGRFSVLDVPYGETAVVVMAPGFTGRRIPIVVSSDATPELEVALDPGFVLRGRASGEDADPLAGVQVSGGGEWYEHAAAQTNTQGEYELEGLPAGSFELTFQHEGYRSTRRTVDVSRESRADVVLSRGVTVSGVVLSADGKAAAKAYVQASSSVAGADEGSVPADSSGRFSMSGLSPGRYTFTASSTDGGEAKAEDVDVEHTGPLRLVLTRARTAVLIGRVIGLPPSAEDRFVFVEAKGDQGSDRGQVDATGAFRLEGVPTGAVRVSAVMTAGDGSMRSSRVSALEIVAGTESETVIEFANDITVSGTVVRDGLPAAGASVSFQSKSGPLARALTDASGRYSVQGLEAGLYEVEVSGIDLSYQADHAVSATSELDIDATGAALAGSVADAASGNPIDDAEVSLWRLDDSTHPTTTVRTNASGTFQARSVREGAYRLLTSKDGYGQDARPLELRRGAAEDVRVDLTPSEGLSVRVVDARDDRALEAVVAVRDMAHQVVANRHSGVGTDGTLTIPLAPGPYLLSTSATGYGTATLQVNAPGHGLRVPLTPGGTLVVESARELRGRLRLLGPDGEEYVRCWCNGIGGFDLDGHRTTAPNITPGSYRLELFDLAGRPIPAQPSVMIQEGRVTTIVVE